MRNIGSLLVYLLVVFVGGALVAPWMYWAVQAIAPGSHLAQSPFHRFVNRSLLGLALAGIWPLARSLGMRSWRDVGIVNPQGKWRLLRAGAMLGFYSLGSVALIVLGAHARVTNRDIPGGTLIGKLAGAAVTAVLVAVLEELLFRGAIFGALRKVWNWRAALVASSMIYAMVHFMESAELTGPVTWSSGLVVLPRMLAGFGNLEVVIPGFFNLMLAGMLLGMAYQRTGNLYYSMGLHAGWIFWLKSYGMATLPVAGANEWFWGTQKLIDGWLALVVLAFAGWVVSRLAQARSPEKPA